MEINPSNPLAYYGGWFYIVDGNYLMCFGFGCYGEGKELSPEAATSVIWFPENLYDIEVAGNQMFLSAGCGYVYKCSLADPAYPALEATFFSQEIANYPSRPAGLMTRPGGYVYALKDSGVCAVFYLSDQF